jgi:hypothetical protein
MTDLTEIRAALDGLTDWTSDVSCGVMPGGLQSLRVGRLSDKDLHLMLHGPRYIRALLARIDELEDRANDHRPVETYDFGSKTLLASGWTLDHATGDFIPPDYTVSRKDRT